MIRDLGAHPPLYLLLAILLVAALIARRVPVLRTLLMLAVWGAMAALLVIVIGQRERFDPYLGRIASMLQLDGQTVVGHEVRIRMAADGHFWARARIAGIERRMLVDSGATLTSLSSGTAAAAGLEVDDATFPVLIKTANGTIEAQTSNVADLQLGDISARNLAVVVSPAFGDTDVLGMNFLSKLKSWRVEGTTLILVPHHPQGRA
jgi:aspartyl protease family protein